MPSLWLGWWWRGQDDSGFEENFSYLLPDKIAHPGRGDIACEQLDGMRPRPFSPLVSALTAGPTAEGWRPAAGTDLQPLIADRAARRFAPPPFWSSGYHPEGPSIDFITHYASDEIGTSFEFRRAGTQWHAAWPAMYREFACELMEVAYEGDRRHPEMHDAGRRVPSELSVHDTLAH
jgi:hypothetical protein